MSVYAGHGNTPGGSPYAAKTAGRSPLPGVEPLKASKDSMGVPQHKGNGGILGGLESAAGWVGSKASLAGHDLAGIPGGLVHLGSAFGHDLAVSIEHPGRQIGPTWGEVVKHPIEAFAKHPRGSQLSPQVAGFAAGAKESLRHPLRDPFQTAMTVLPAIGAVGKVGELGGLKAFQDVPREVKIGDKKVNLIPSRNPSARAVQRGYDRVVQKAVNKEQSGVPVGRVTARTANHGVNRFNGALAEEERAATRMRTVPADLLDRAAARLNLGKLPRTAREHQAALELTSSQTMPDEAALYHEQQAAAGVHPEQNQAVAKLYRRVGQRNLVHLDEGRPVGEQVHINPAEKHLALTDERLAGVGHRGDSVLIEHGQMTPGGARAAINNPGRVRAGSTYENPTPGKMGVPSHVLKHAEADVARIEKLHARAFAKATGNPDGVSGEDLMRRANNSPTVQNLAGALVTAKDRLQKLEDAHYNRIQPTGLIGGEDARPGRTHISYRTTEKTAQPNVFARISGKVKNRPASPISNHQFTGEAIRQGKVPKDVTGMKSRAYRQIVRHENSVAQARTLWETGSDTSNGTGHEMLFANPDSTGSLPKIGPELRQAVGQEAATFDKAHELSKQEADAATAEGVRAAVDSRIAGWFNRSHERANGMGGIQAPKDYRWVDERIAKGLQDQVSPPGRVRGGAETILRPLDNVNSAVTTATVYAKVGHTFTRGLTNAATNLMQGSLHPLEVAKTWKLEKDAKAQLGNDYQLFRQRILAAAGQMGYSALPHEGTEGAIGRAVSTAARKGSGFWARRFDAPFRINALLYELRDAGYHSVDEVQRALDGIQSGGRGLPAHEWSKLSAAFRRADREAISYDRLNPAERDFLSRIIWFYPWVKGSTMFTLRSMVEHPYKMGALGQTGAQGRNEQAKELGPVPSYEQGLIALGGGKSPETVDMSTFSPFATAGQLANIPSVPGGLSNQLNPAVGSLIQATTGTNQYGEPSNSPWTDALRSLVAPTSEAQIAESISRRHQDTSGKMFPGMTPSAELKRYLLGPGFAIRRVNKAALAKAASREHAKRYTVYGK